MQLGIWEFHHMKENIIFPKSFVPRCSNVYVFFFVFATLKLVHAQKDSKAHRTG